jgi:O-antigen/teichoic acid export membrane protein
MTTPADVTPGADESARAAMVQRARAGARVMTARGALMRLVSVAANLVLLALVTPAELGVLAVVRGTLSVIQYTAELGVDRALLRRAAHPERREFAALSGMQIVIVLGALLLGLAVPRAILGFGALDPRWHHWMLLAVASLLAIAPGTGARVRLERAMRYERVAAVDVLNVVILNTGLLAAALLGHFVAGVFVVHAVLYLATNALLFAWSPGPRPSLRLGALRALVRQSLGFLATQGFTVAREFGTPVLVASLFGLHVAGLWAFAVRVAQLLNVSFDGFRRALVPAAAQLAHDRASLERLATNTLAGAAALAIPFAAVAIVSLPVVPALWPRWGEAVPLAQLYVLGYAVAGVVGASFEPVAVAVRGAVAALGEQAAATLACWIGIVVLRALGVPELGWVIPPMMLAPVIVLYAMTDAGVRPRWSEGLAPLLAGFATAVVVWGLSLLARVPPIPAAALSILGLLVWVRPWRMVASIPVRVAAWRASVAPGDR